MPGRVERLAVAGMGFPGSLQEQTVLKCVGMICILQLLVACVICGCRGDKPAPPATAEGATQSAQVDQEMMPPIWERIIQEATALSAVAEEIPEAPSPDRTDALERLAARKKRVAQEIASCYGRDGIVSLIDGYQQMYDRADEDGDWDWVMSVESLARNVIEEIADPVNEYGLTSMPTGSKLAGAYSPFAHLAAVAIDLYKDEWAYGALLELSLQQGIGLDLLRAYPAERARHEIENALRELETSNVRGSQETYRITAVRSLLASYDYAAGLNETDREQFWRFERRLWGSWALAQTGARIVSEYYATALMLVSGQGKLVGAWQEGDERFVLRIFEEPTSTLTELRIATHLAHKLPPEGRQRLAEIAESDSPHAQYARQALERAD